MTWEDPCNNHNAIEIDINSKGLVAKQSSKYLLDYSRKS